MSHRQSVSPLPGLWSGLSPVTALPETAEEQRTGNVLGRISFADAPAAPGLDDGILRLTTHMANELVPCGQEIWRTDRPVRAGDAVFAEDGEHLFYAARLGPRPVYRDSVRELYENALRFTWERGYTDRARGHRPRCPRRPGRPTRTGRRAARGRGERLVRRLRHQSG